MGQGSRDIARPPQHHLHHLHAPQRALIVAACTQADGSTAPHLVVATLDVNIGSKLPAEELRGRRGMGRGRPAAGGRRQQATVSRTCDARLAGCLQLAGSSEPT